MWVKHQLQGEDGGRNPGLLDVASAHHFGLSLGLTAAVVVVECCWHQFLFVVTIRPCNALGSFAMIQIPSNTLKHPQLSATRCVFATRNRGEGFIESQKKLGNASLSPVAFMVLAHLLYGNACAKGRGPTGVWHVTTGNAKTT